MTFSEYIASIDFLNLYKKKILPKKGGGRDNVSPETYLKSFKNEIDWLRDKLIDGSYRFSPYREKLLLKGKNMTPRVLSLPSVRDRFALSLLNEYLSSHLGITQMIPNLYITKITKFINTARAAKKDVFFFKTDISTFFDNINHSVLLNYLSNIIDGTAIRLVIRAITTPTISDSTEYTLINSKGLPQGLAISNTLANHYVSGFHKEMEKSLNNCLFLRYVDDMIVLSTRQHDFKRIIINSIDKHNLGLELTTSKTVEGKIEDGFDFLGYHIIGESISVKKKNKDYYSNRLVKRCSLLKKQFEDTLIRPRYASADEEFLNYAEAELNLMISGFKAGNHNYGWIAYFQRINDLSMLYQFDRLIRNHLGKKLCGQITINSIVDTYFALKKNGGKNYLIDFDQIHDRGKRIAYLRKFGYIKLNDPNDISNEEVDRLFNRMVANFQKQSERDVAEKS